MKLTALLLHIFTAYALFGSFRHIYRALKKKRKDYIPFEILKIGIILAIWSALYFWVLKN